MPIRPQSDGWSPGSRSGIGRCISVKRQVAGGSSRRLAPQTAVDLVDDASAWAHLRRQENLGARHQQWLQAQKFQHPAQQLALQEMILAARHAVERLQRVGAAIVEFLPGSNAS
jgi:hypothetical protein